ncbi:MAG: hypothetical protein JXD23_09165 [Spirochaetales bacterium]|nr:hypothetical protein [Spirochaetales bacterium]
MAEGKPSWSYRALVESKLSGIDSLLDIDTGGGEFLASIKSLPPVTCAAEGHPPNVPLARARLGPLGVRLFDTAAGGPLPFGDDSFDLVISRHGRLPAAEILRVLKPGRSIVTQQVGDRNNIRLNKLLGSAPVFRKAWDLETVVREMEQNGFRIIDRREEFPAVEFKDIGAVVYYLKAIPWQIADFSLEKYQDRLRGIHDMIMEDGKLETTGHRFYIEAQKS